MDNGLHASNGEIHDPDYHNIGNVDLIGKRSHRVVPVAPGGTLSDYVPFYFTPFSIMMFNIHTGYNVRQVPNEEIVILVSSLHRVAEMIRRYWVLGIECTYLEVQKLGWFLERTVHSLGFEDPLKLHFTADKYGPYSERLRHLLNALDGTYLHCDKRLSDAGASDTIWFDEQRRQYLDLYLKQDASKELLRVLDLTAKRIDGFESPLGMELLATVDWLIQREHSEPTLQGVRSGLRKWPAGEPAAERKLRLFDDRMLKLALDQLARDFETESTQQ